MRRGQGIGWGISKTLLALKSRLLQVTDVSMSLVTSELPFLCHQPATGPQVIYREAHKHIHTHPEPTPLQQTASPSFTQREATCTCDQPWRLLSSCSSLLSKAAKGMYFPHRIFFLLKNRKPPSLLPSHYLDFNPVYYNWLFSYLNFLCDHEFHKENTYLSSYWVFWLQQLAGS